MLDICWECGAERSDKNIRPDGSETAIAVCPECGHEHTFRYVRLPIVSGAAGTGKTTVQRALVNELDGWVLLEYDDLLHDAMTFESDVTFIDYCLKICRDVAQSGGAIAFFGTAPGVPDNVEPCDRRRYFSDICYLALTCEEAAQRQRLETRAKQISDTAVENQVEFNQWFRQHADEEGVELLDTTETDPRETITAVGTWLRDHGPELNDS